MSEFKYKIALISYAFKESTLGLARALAASGCHVDYYCMLVSTKIVEFPAFEIPQSKRSFFKSYRLEPTECRGASFAIDNERVRLFAYQSTPLGINSSGLKKAITSILLNISIKRLCKIIKKEKYDFIDVIMQGEPGMLFIKHLKGETVINSLHEPFKNHLSDRTLVNNVNYAISHGKRIRVFSESARTEIAAVYPQIIPSVHCIPFGLFNAYKDFIIQNPSDLRDYILFYGFIRPYKGLEYLYNAYTQVLKERPETKLVIAGSGQDPYLELFSKLPQCTVINKHISNDELSSLISNCRFVVCPYKSASQSGIPQTVFIYGKPIVATNVGAFPDYIKPKITGQLVEYGDVEALKNAMLSMFEDETQYREYVSNIQDFETLSPETSWPNISERYQQMIDDIKGLEEKSN